MHYIPAPNTIYTPGFRQILGEINMASSCGQQLQTDEAIITNPNSTLDQIAAAYADFQKVAQEFGAISSSSQAIVTAMSSDLETYMKSINITVKVGPNSGPGERGTDNQYRALDLNGNPATLLDVVNAINGKDGNQDFSTVEDHYTYHPNAVTVSDSIGGWMANATATLALNPTAGTAADQNALNADFHKLFS